MAVVAGDMMLDVVNRGPIAVVAHHSCPPVMLCWLLMKSFAGVRLLVMICRAPKAFVGVDATIFRQAPASVGDTTE